MELFTVMNEGKRFICHLVADRPLVEPYVVQITSEVNYSEINAKESIATMTLEIFPARDPVLDEWLYDFYQNFSDLNSYLNGFKQIVKAIPNDQ